MKRYSFGYTLIEVVVAMLIIAILAAIAIPSYRTYVLRANRSVARGTLVNLAAQQEVQSLKNGGYATDFSSLNGTPTGTTSFYITNEGTVQTASDETSIYQIAFASAPAASTSQFGFNATAVGTQADDTSCASLTITSTGLKQAVDSSGNSATTCWNK